MNDELKSLVADAAKLFGLELIWDGVCPPLFSKPRLIDHVQPARPERGDLMKVAMAARLDIEFQSGQVWAFNKSGQPDYFDFVWDDHPISRRPRNSSRSISCASFSWRCDDHSCN